MRALFLYNCTPNTLRSAKCLRECRIKLIPTRIGLDSFDKSSEMSYLPHIKDNKVYVVHELDL